MTSVRSRVFAALLAAVPTAGLLAVASPAQAATLDITVKSVSISKSVFVLGSGAGCQNFTITAVTSAPIPTAGYEIADVGADIEAPSGKTVNGGQFAQVGSTATYKGTFKMCGKDTAGRYTVNVYGAQMKAGSEPELTNVVSKKIYLKRPSKLTLNAAPEPVVKGKKLTAKGVLKVNGKVLGGAKVKVYFKPAGATTFTYKGTATTNGKGVYSKKFTATKSGVWQVVYAGNTSRNAATAVDGVKVK
ncbi:hypothetical protein [Actinoplanes campanulatus]|uniref:hypothetical protein n=1 Tax=Actinoplanes campanulatus TaxID=113559 RepID=UPI0019450520|nr:hypothetical protein [Actinoplanes campanulatus]GID39470.1 hypothetical protein Aca09nite_59760 [Actinoplanes campanulatus]